MDKRILDNHLASLTARSGRKVNNRLSSELRTIGLSLDAWLVLNILVTEGAKSMSEIADDLVLNLATTTKLIDRMVSDNLVYRKPNPKDRRVVNIFPSDAGIIRHQTAKKLVEKEQKALEKNYPDVKPLMHNLRRLMEVLDKMDSDA